jgi:copper chaperone NosL
MVVSDPHFAAQVLAPGEEPRIFDDIGCMAAALAKEPPPGGAVLYVADHRTGEWVDARAAVFTRVPSLETPMGSHIVAHASSASRAADAQAAGGQPLTREQVFSGLGQSLLAPRSSLLARSSPAGARQNEEARGARREVRGAAR